MAKRNIDKPGSRRSFLRGLAVAPVLPASLGALSLGDSAERQDTAPPVPAQVDALAAIVQLRFGQYLTDGDMAEVKRGLERTLRYSETLSAVKLSNSDEPDFIFHPHDSLQTAE